MFMGAYFGLAPPLLAKTSASAHDSYFFSKGVLFVNICLLINNE